MQIFLVFFQNIKVTQYDASFAFRTVTERKPAHQTDLQLQILNQT